MDMYYGHQILFNFPCRFGGLVTLRRHIEAGGLSCSLTLSFSAPRSTSDKSLGLTAGTTNIRNVSTSFILSLQNLAAVHRMHCNLKRQIRVKLWVWYYVLMDAIPTVITGQQQFLALLEELQTALWCLAPACRILPNNVSSFFLKEIICM